ncbi:hypothetical protein ACFX13_034660 [Malus domestica]
MCGGTEHFVRDCPSTPPGDFTSGQATVDISQFRILAPDKAMMAVGVVVGVMVAILIRTTGVIEVCSLVAEVARVLEEMTAGVLSFRPSSRLEHLLVTVIKGTE